PFATALAFFGRASLLWKSLKGSSPWSLFGVDLVLFLAIPLGVQLAELRWLSTQSAALASSDTKTRLAALRTLNAYPLLLGRGDSIVCSIYFGDAPETLRHNSNPEVARELEKLVGGNVETACRRWID